MDSLRTSLTPSSSSNIPSTGIHQTPSSQDKSDLAEAIITKQQAPSASLKNRNISTSVPPKTTSITGFFSKSVSGRGAFSKIKKSVKDATGSIFKSESKQALAKAKQKQNEADSKYLEIIYSNTPDKEKKLEQVRQEFNEASSEVDRLTKEISSQPSLLSKLNFLAKPLKNSRTDAIQNTALSHLPQVNPEDKNLNDYLTTFSPKVDLKTAKASIHSGEELFNDISTDPQAVLAKTALKSPAMQKQEVTDLTWFLMSKGIEKGKGFREGTFVIEGKDGGESHKKVYEYLKGHPQKYERHQSHFKGRVPKDGYGFGIDIQSGPAGKKHLLFEEIDGARLFVKPENFGTKTKVDFLRHAGEFITAQGRKYAPKIFGSNQQQGMRKERVPPETLTAFKELVGENPELMNEAKTKGVGFMRQYIEKGDFTSKQDGVGKFVASLPKDIESEYQTGNEVFLKL